MTTFLDENFEASPGFDTGVTHTWATYAGNTGAANPDYTTNPLRGAQSLRMKDDDDEGTYAVVEFTASPVNTLYGFFRFKITDYPNTTKEVFQTYLSEAEPHENIWISETGNLAIQTGENGIIATGPTALALNTPYYIWFYFTRTTTANGSGWIKVGTTGTIPGTNELSWTNARVPNLGLAFAGFTTYHGAGYDFLVDQFILADQAIGSVADAPISTITLSVR